VRAQAPRKEEYMETMSNMRKDFIASYLRSQVNKLTGLLSNMEEQISYNNDHLEETLKEIEINLRRIRKFFKEGY
jgi:hypothetical protein